MRRVFVVGGSITPFIGKGNPNFIWKKHPEFGKRENATIEELITKATLDAFANTGVAGSVFDRVVMCAPVP